MRSSSTCVLVSTLALALGGCNSARPPSSAHQDPVQPYPNVTVDPSLEKYLAVDYGLIVAQPPTPDRPMFVQVPVRSQADNQFAIQYNFEFFGADNRRLGETGWKFDVLPARRQRMLTGNPITDKAVAWRLDIRSAR